MGASIRPREFDVDQPSHTEELSNWISRVRSKKIICRRNRRRNLRVEAVLSYTLSRAECELRSKQTSRFLRWQQLKETMTHQNGCDNNLYYNGGEEHHQDQVCQVQPNPWQGPLCSELSSLDSFMSMLKEVKSPLQR